jgi:TRAP-type C4-dicarboxylate transport system permease small subunit
MLTLALAVCLIMICYGVIRFAIAKWRRQENAGIHMLWIPGAALFYAICITATVLVSMA